MAGIGFELRRAISQGGLGTFVKAAFSGIMIVAGPWLLSIIGITVIERFMAFAVEEAPDHFIGVVIYSYAWSLVLFGGLHFIYTRMMADMLFVHEERRAAGALVFFLVPAILVTVAVSGIAVQFIDVPVARPGLFRASAVVLFVSINLIWLLMIFISLLKWFFRIFIIYAVGMITSLLLVYLLGRLAGTAGALAGYAAGQLAIAVLLFLLAFIAHKPEDVMANAKRFREYIRRFLPLFLTGVFYSWGIWVDKIVFWFTRGSQIPGTFIWLYSEFDIPVYLANLSMIPGLVFFIIDSETSFYIALRSFLVSLGRGTYAEIQKRKLAVISDLRRGVTDQSLFHGVITLILVGLAPAIASVFGVNDQTLRLILVGVFAHLMFLTVMNFSFYLEFFATALSASLIFFLVNLSGALTSLPGLPTLTPGMSYLCAAIAAGAFCATVLFASGRRLDRIILARVSGV